MAQQLCLKQDTWYDNAGRPTNYFYEYCQLYLKDLIAEANPSQ